MMREKQQFQDDWGKKSLGSGLADRVGQVKHRSFSSWPYPGVWK